MRPRLLSSTAFLGLVAVACGGASQTDLFGPDGTSSSATEPPPGAGSTSGGSTPPSSSGGSSSSSGGGSSSSSSSSGGGSSSSSSSSGGSSSGSSGDAGPPAWKSPGIYCGTNDVGTDVYCATSTSLCCGHHHRGGDEFQCVSAGAGACLTGIAIRCDDRTDCPSGQVCCATFDQNFGYRSVQCQTQCTTNIPNTLSVRFCDPNAPADECAAVGRTCTASNSLDGFSFCK